MLSAINNIYLPKLNNIQNSQVNKKQSVTKPIMNNGLKSDSVCFTGKSAPSMYKNVFEYLAAEILGNNKKYQVDGSMLSATKISDAVKGLFEQDKIYLPFKRSNHLKIKWKSYIPQDVRVFSIDKINEARGVRMAQWESFLKNPEKALDSDMPNNPALVRKIKNDKALKLVIWNAITSEIKENNRHIPVPFNQKALLETISGFEKIEPKDRAVRCASPSFLEIYTHRLRDNLLMDLGLSDNESVWVKIPSLAHDPAHKEKNIAMLETLSCKNWCTRSSVDKAEDALTDGDFYIYLERDKSNLWEPLVGMTTSRGKLDQIQGTENNNIVPLNLVNEIKTYIKDHNIKCHSGIIDEGPKASQAIMISDKLSEIDPELKKSFAKVIKENNDIGMFKYLGVKTEQLEDGTLKIGTYKPSYNMNANSGISIPYSMFGLNEDELLRNVKVINGNFILDNKNKLFDSRITKFPPSLEQVTGKISCKQEQYERFGADIDRVLGGDKSRLIIHS